MKPDTIISSDLKQYLLDPDLSLISKIKIGLRYYITAQPELILQLNLLKRRFSISSFRDLNKGLPLSFNPRMDYVSDNAYK